MNDTPTPAMTTDGAIAIVARHALNDAASGIRWEDYPDIGGHDWVRVLAKIDGWAKWSDTEGRYYDAYSHLAARATQEATP